MRSAIISDIHGNLEALLEVLKDIEQFHVDCIISLGDNIGYGPDPERVLQLLSERNIPSIMGNHELAIDDDATLSWFNASARKSLEITRSLLSPWGIDFVKALKPTYLAGASLCVHGFPPDSILTYLFQVSDERLLDQLGKLEQEVCFVGHTHELALVSSDGGVVRHESLSEGSTDLREGRKYIVNAGSVGQPRDGDNRSKYIIWDNDSRRLQVRFIPYNIAGTVEKILALGFPRINAERLW